MSTLGRVMFGLTAFGLIVGFLACVGNDPDIAAAGADAAGGDSRPPENDAGTDDATCWEKAFATPIPIPELNSPDVELRIHLSANELTAYVNTFRDAGSPDAGSATWIAIRPTAQDKWGAPTPLTGNAFHEDDTHASVSPDDLSLYFTKVVREDGGTQRDIYVVTRPSMFPPTSFADYPAVPVPSVNTLGADEAFPHFAYNDLFFARSDRIFHSPKVGAGFGAPVEITSAYDVGAPTHSPVVSADGLTMYFSSTRVGSKGGFDIWVARRPSATATFGPATNVAELNTGSNERPGHVSADGCQLYLTSDRPGGAGGLDIWMATRTP